MELRRNMPDIKVVGLSMHEEGELSSAMRRAGAVAYVTKGAAPESLVEAIRKAMNRKPSCLENEETGSLGKAAHKSSWGAAQN